MASGIDKVTLCNIVLELIKNDPTIKNYGAINSPRDLAKKWNRNIEKIAYEIVGDFLKVDKFFRVVGDKPMPKVTPQNFGDVVKMIRKANGKEPSYSEILKRLKSNVLTKWALKKGYMPRLHKNLKF